MFGFSALHLAPRIASSHTESEAEQRNAREWLKNFNTNTVPRSLCEISFSRSSGPGGQNVNKYVVLKRLSLIIISLTIETRVNSKATLRVPMKDLLGLVPSLLHHRIRASQYYAERSDSLVFQADSNRKQADNVDLCFTKLRGLILAAGRSSVEGETSPEQADRVERLYAKLLPVGCSLLTLVT